MPSILPPEPPTQDVGDPLTITTPCLLCGYSLPIGASINDRGDVDLEFVDLYAHVWTHEVRP